jgi:hypothetical protein
LCRYTKKGFTGQLLKVTPSQFTNPDGLNATTDEGNANILKITLQTFPTGEIRQQKWQ